MPQIEAEIEALELELNLMEETVLTAKERVAGTDPEWEKHKSAALENMCKLVLQFKMEDPPHKAVAILSRMFVDAREIVQQRKLIQQFDEKRKRLHTLMSREEARKKAFAKAGEAAQNQSWRATA